MADGRIRQAVRACALVMVGFVVSAPFSVAAAASAGEAPGHAAKKQPVSSGEFGAAGTLAPLKARYGTGHFGYGAKATRKEIAGWDIDSRPDGQGLPPGHGSVEDGGNLFQTYCAACHGAFGEGVGRYPKLSGGIGTLTDPRPDKTVGSYWPYATTLFSYVHKAMPFPAPESLTDDQTYAIVAYILNLSNIVPDSFVASRKNLAAVKMPNRNGFIRPDPRPDTHNTDCMKNCRTDVKITSSAENKKLTPRTTGKLDERLIY